MERSVETSFELIFQEFMDRGLYKGLIFRPASTMERAEALDDYDSLSRQELVEQLKSLKSQLRAICPQAATPASINQPSSPKASQALISSRINSQTKLKKKNLDFRRHSFRKIALKLSYVGSQHGGLAWQPEITPLSTVEAELFKALLIARLVEGDTIDANFEDEKWRDSVDINKWGYSRAGRTDAGVSGSGQVVSLWVRSKLSEVDPAFGFRQAELEPVDNQSSSHSRSESSGEELPYHTMLNSILPPSVRVLAWSPVSADFDARFSCSARHYKYFFSLYECPYSPPLNIEAMRDAAQRFVGEHDFRNFCRLDPSKQIENFHRRILSAQINHVGLDHQTASPPCHPRYPAMSNQTNPLYVFDLVGTAFLYNMVRHIVAVLFLVGSGHESPNIIDALLYTDPAKPKPDSFPLGMDAITTKPQYAHASSLPLVLYHCIYPHGSFSWNPTPEHSFRPLTANPFVTWSQDRLRAIISHHHISSYLHLVSSSTSSKTRPTSMVTQPLGAADYRSTNTYRALLTRPRLAPYAESNAQWWARTGARRLAKRQLL
ncbi:hypothetical protein O181_081354 [Austropuccinia psidii MF-1]|uniref:Pseudouridine synthase I TruA alpha/beta domain-containing protein n=1 Tax=Austropuccinia psidii MF-1 TaxID=1389203 RepID=A0A9Q3FMQ0_9BASI|nr:hypothetical protein [Austropuccinia psidii MF-1]